MVIKQVVIVISPNQLSAAAAKSDYHLQVLHTLLLKVVRADS